jgi:hypothetical protein
LNIRNQARYVFSNYRDLSRIVMERARTAEEAVSIVGAIINKLLSANIGIHKYSSNVRSKLTKSDSTSLLKEMFGQ